MKDYFVKSYVIDNNLVVQKSQELVNYATTNDIVNVLLSAAKDLNIGKEMLRLL